ncbi:MAG: helix-turn-helix domain-containing protein, partial [Actinophytocola sp.]|nr:helix-turn-helix domain-containing protein [Actinophytocola sp.]
MAGDQHSAFGDLLRRHRLVAGLSQQALAERAGISVDAVAALERGRRRSPRAFTVRVLADTLGLGQAQLEQLVEVAKATAGGQRGRAPRAPAPVTPLVGRAAERDAVAALLRQDGYRLVTLTGPGGVGKTQLALAVARRVADDFPDGIGWAPLALLDGADALTQAVASAFGVREKPGNAVLDSLTEQIAARDQLLVLDNCEHLASACAALVDRLLAEVAGLRVLATSRERLRLAAEVVRPVTSLPVPRGRHRDDLEHSPAAHLFVQRARQLVPYFEIAPGDEPALVRICQELDGLPLAIELAAARS